MTTLDPNVLAAFQQMKSAIRHINRRRRTIGRYGANGQLEADPTAGLPAGCIWVHDERRVPARAKNLTTEAAPGIDVVVAFNVDTGEDDVIGVDTLTTPLRFGDAAAALNSPRKLAATPTPTSAGDIIVGGLFADEGGGLVMRIAPTWTPFGAWWDGTGLITITPTATSGSKSFAVVGIQPDGMPIVTLTANRPLAYPLVTVNRLPTIGGAADIKAVTDAAPAVWWVGAVEVAHGETALNPAKIVDRRFWALPALSAGVFTTLATSGNAVIGTAGANSARLNINAAAGGKGVIVRANTTPDDLIQLQDSTGFTLSKFTPSGGLGLGVPNPQHFFQVNNVFAPGTGTISTSGTTITGSGTVFNAELVAGSTVYAGGQARRVTSVGTNTLATINSAFSPDLPAGTTFIHNKPIFVMDQATGNAGMGVAPVSDVNLYLYGNLRVGGTGGGVVYIRTTTHALYYNNPDLMYEIAQASGDHRLRANSIDRLRVINGGAVTIYPQTAALVALDVRGFSAAQSGNLVDFKTSAGVSLGSISAIGAATHAPRDAATSSITTALTLGHNTSGTPAADYGTAIQWQLESSTTENVPVGREVVQWHTPTHASRSPDWVLYLSDAGGEREILRGRADGSAAVGFFGASPVGQQAGGAATAGATYGVTEQTMLQNVYDALRAFGLIS